MGVLPFAFLKFARAKDRISCLFWTSCSSLGLAFVRGAWISILVMLVVAGAFLTLKKGCEVVSIDGRFRTVSAIGGLVAVFLFSMVPAKIQKNAGEAMWHEKSSVSQAVASVATLGGDKGGYYGTLHWR